METRAAGRICIFGEHQDYLGHPVIAGAIDLFIHIRGEARKDRKFIIHKRDFNEVETFAYPAEGLIRYTRARDYFRSVPNVLRQRGISIDHGAEVEVWGRIPIAAGASSSSALNVAWMRFLTQMYGADFKDDPLEIGELSFVSEVASFGEPGGRMDQYTSSLGGINFLDFKNNSHERLKGELEGFVLIDSLQKKDTFAMLQRVKAGQAAALERIAARYKGKDILELSEKELAFLPVDLLPYGRAAVLNHRLTMKGREILKSDALDERMFGLLLQQQHEILRHDLKNTTQKIDRLLDIALENGALGGKMNGSGGGGTLFVYAPGKEETIVEKIAQSDLEVNTYIIKTISGTVSVNV